MAFMVSSVLAQNTQQDKVGKLRMISNVSKETKLEIGEEISIDFKINYWEMPPSDLFVLILPAYGDQLIMGNLGKVTLKNLKSKFISSFTGKDASKFKISQENYPISAQFNMTDIAGFPIDIFFARDISELKEKKEYITFAFLTSLGAGGNGTTTGSLKFTPPSLSEYYDTILIRPYIFEYKNEKGERCGTHDSSKMNSINIPVIPDLPRPPPPKKEKKPIEVIGNITIYDYQPSGARLRLGVPNTIKLFLSYKDLEPNSEIYVMLNTVHGKDYMRKDGLKAKVGNMKFSLVEDPKMTGGLYKIAQKNKPALGEGIAFMGPFEAAYIATIKEGGSGEVSETIEFTPPPYAVYYDGIKITPVYFKWGKDQKHIAYCDTDKMIHIIIPIEGRR
jgi:hypothetical protein